jgi:hypothetical protein
MRIKNSARTVSTFKALQTGYRIIARFGDAKLVKKADGRHELIGGTANDQTNAREWCSLFAPEVVFSGTARSGSGVAFAE